MFYIPKDFFVDYDKNEKKVHEILNKYFGSDVYIEGVQYKIKCKEELELLGEYKIVKNFDRILNMAIN